MMLTRITVLILITFLCFTAEVQNARILGLFEFPSRSHHILGSALLKALAKKGHQVTMVSAFPLKTPLKNYEDIELTGSEAFKDELMGGNLLINNHNQSTFSQIMTMQEKFFGMNNYFLNHSKTRELLNSDKEFDLIIMDWFANDVNLGIAHRFNVPVIGVGTSGGNFMTNKITGNPEPPSVVPNVLLGLPTHMNFFQRLQNTLMNGFFKLFGVFVLEGLFQDLYKIYFPGYPPLDEVRKNVSLILLNSHFSLESPRPYLPNMIQIGGFHLEEAKKLTGELKEFMDSAKEGVLYFSLGSNVKSSDLPKEKLDAITKTFAKLPLKVLWKFESDNLPDLPANVKVNKWFPQADILGHPNLKVFVTHGGLLSTTEAVFHGIPIVGIPIFADQSYNIRDSVGKGYALQVTYEDLSEETLTEAITEILHNPRYRENIKERSALLKDQPIKPMDNAVFWVEYVMRHKGAYHMKSSIVDLTWYQYFLLDVLTFLGIIAATVILVVIVISRKIIALFRKPRIQEKTNQKTIKKVKKSKRE